MGVIESWLERGATVLYVLRTGQIAGAIALEDGVRESSREAVRGLHAAGVRVATITGDARNVAETVGWDLGIDEVFAEVLPEHKAEQVVTLQERGLRVAMVGDGVNDAPALAQADVGLAIGASTDVAIESAGVILAADSARRIRGHATVGSRLPRDAPNLVSATGYNVVAIPLATGVLAFAGIVMPPALAPVFMSASPVVVAAILPRLDLGVEVGATEQASQGGSGGLDLSVSPRASTPTSNR